MAYQSYVSFTGTKQGQFHGQSPNSKRPNYWIAAESFRYSTQQPYNPGSKTTGGRRPHSPIVITKQNDAATPLLVQAYFSKEVLSEIVVEFTQADGGNEVLVSRLTLTNAVINRFFPGPGKSTEFVFTYADLTWDMGIIPFKFGHG